MLLLLFAPSLSFLVFLFLRFPCFVSCLRRLPCLLGFFQVDHSTVANVVPWHSAQLNAHFSWQISTLPCLVFSCVAFAGCFCCFSFLFASWLFAVRSVSFICCTRLGPMSLRLECRHNSFVMILFCLLPLFALLVASRFLSSFAFFLLVFPRSCVC